jgi:membrane dipeptidase
MRLVVPQPDDVTDANASVAQVSVATQRVDVQVERMTSGVASPVLSVEARALLASCDFIDLHIDSFIATRVLGYDVGKQHAPITRGRLFGHVDLPRAKAGGLTGGLWSITTNPTRRAEGRLKALRDNLVHLQRVVDNAGPQARIVTSAHAYDDAKAAGAHAVLPVVQGANCLGDARDFAEAQAGIGDLIVSATLVPLTSSSLGETSTPVVSLLGPRGLSDRGRDVVRSMNAQHILVDLAHASPRTFWDAMAVHDQSQPLLVTHTGVSGVTPHWRNLDDDQLRAVASTGGVVGVIFQRSFLQRKGGPDDVEMVVEHLEHIVQVVGEDHAAIGTDYDGAIVPPRGLTDVTTLPVLVDALLRRGHSPERVDKILGKNFLRCLRAVRP